MPLTRLRHHIATDPDCQDHADRDGEPHPRNTGDRAGHIEPLREAAHTYWPDHIGDFGPP
jgi:hypothetical protein